MGSLNQVTLIGNLTRDPEIRFMQNGGDAVTSGGIAMNESWTDDRGNKRESVTFVDFEMWGKQGEALAQYCKKGKQVCITGKLKMDEWTDKESGQKRSKLKVRAYNVVFLGGPEEGQGGNQRQAPRTGGEGRPAGGGNQGGTRAPQGGNQGGSSQSQDVDFDDIPFAFLITCIGLGAMQALGA